MGNTVGSKFSFRSAEDFYCLGLWLADGYWRSSSIGLTSINPKLIERFTIFLKRIAPDCRIFTRIYPVQVGQKRRHVGIQVYINNRPLTRLFLTQKTGPFTIPAVFLVAYLAGRIDGDGSVDTRYRSGIRIAYSNREDAERDRKLFGETDVSLYQYVSAGTYVLYLRKKYRDRLLDDLRRYSLKLAP